MKAVKVAVLAAPRGVSAAPHGVSATPPLQDTTILLYMKNFYGLELLKNHLTYDNYHFF